MGLQEEGGGKDVAAGRKPRGRKPGQRVRTPLEIARDRRLISRLKLLKRLTNVEIAEEVNKAYANEEEEYELERKEPGTHKLTYKLVRRPHLSPEQVGKEIKALEARLLAEATNDTKALRLIMVQELDELERYCLERYEATIGKHTKTTTTDGERANTRVEEEELSGERGYLELALRCKQERADLLSLYPPRKTALTNPDGTKPYDAFGESEELKRLNVALQDILKGGAV